MKIKTCCNCEKDKPVTEFFKQSRAKDGFQSRCKECSADFKKYYQENKQRYHAHAEKRRQDVSGWINEIKTESGCTICNESRYWCLDFHHPNDDKRSAVSTMISGGLAKKTILEEVEKCEIVCKNCHADIHHSDMGELEIPQPS